jgi:hypothetical protein
LPHRAVEDSEAAIALAEPTTPLLLDAARIHGFATNEPNHNEMALHYLRRAIDRGLDPRSLMNDLFFESLRGAPEFEELLAAPPTEMERVDRPRLLDPLADW